MRKQHLLASAAFVLAAAYAAPAAADIDLTGLITLNKSLRFEESVIKNKGTENDPITIKVDIKLTALTAVESNAVNNQRIGGCLTPTGGCPEPVFYPGAVRNTHNYTTGDIPQRTGRPVGGVPIDYAAVIDSNSVNRNIGVTQFNQDVGVGSNQANMISAAVGESFANGPTTNFAEANNSAAQYNFNNLVNVTGTRLNGEGAADDTVGTIHAAQIDGSIRGNIGVVQVNQNAGVFNNQLNSLSLAFSFDGTAVALAESALGQWNTGGQATDVNVSRTASITNGSVSFNQGVVMGNQAAGYMANQGGVVSISGSF
jgi:hypothetical protein